MRPGYFWNLDFSQKTLLINNQVVLDPVVFCPRGHLECHVTCRRESAQSDNLFWSHLSNKEGYEEDQISQAFLI